MGNKGTWPASSSAAGSAGDAMDANRATAAELWKGIDGQPTTDLENGVLYWGAISGTSYTRNAYVNSTEVPLFAADSALGGPKLVTALFCNDKELNSALLHGLATGSLPTTAKRFWYDTTQARGGYSDGTNKWYWSRCNAAGTTYRRIPCDMNVAQAGTPATANTDTILGGWTLNATAETLNLVAKSRVPAGFTGAHDLKLQVVCLLESAETANDDIDLATSWRSLSPGDGPGKTATAVASTTLDIGTDNSQYDMHVVEVTIDYDDGDNPVAAGDLLVATINLATITGVAGVIVVAADWLVPIFNAED